MKDWEERHCICLTFPRPRSTTPSRVSNPKQKKMESALGVCVCSVMSNSTTLWTIAHQAPLSMGFSRQEYWSKLPFPYSGDLSNPGIESQCPALQADSLLTELPGKSIYIYIYISESLSSIPETNKILFCQLYCQLYFKKNKFKNWI